MLQLKQPTLSLVAVDGLVLYVGCACFKVMAMLFFQPTALKEFNIGG